MATQNPIDQEGTYPLPEAQVDRFMMKVFVDYPSKTEELEIMRRMSNLNFNDSLKTILSKDDIANIRDEINKVRVSEPIEKYIVELVFATRNAGDYGLKEESGYIQFGASPRASIYLNLASKAIAFFDERDYVLPEDVKEVAPDILNHRIILNYEAEADNVYTKEIIEKILKKVPITK
jgi:MoxR-like ATPase